MENSKIRMKVGIHEFEAEGPADVVKEQFAAFREMILSQPCIKKDSKENPVTQDTVNMSDSMHSVHVPIERIMHVSGRVVSLTALPASPQDAALLIMMGHKDMRDNVSVTGQEIGDGLAQSGRPVARVDRIMEPLLTDFVLKTGIKRSTRYRLTNQGANKALSIARDLIATLPA